MLALGEQIEEGNAGNSDEEDRQEIRQFDAGKEPEELRQQRTGEEEQE